MTASSSTESGWSCRDASSLPITRFDHLVFLFFQEVPKLSADQHIVVDVQNEKGLFWSEWDRFAQKSRRIW
jgi:hypothetical protein